MSQFRSRLARGGALDATEVLEPRVEVSLNGSEWHDVLVDTGCLVTLIDRSLLECEGWPEEQIDAGREFSLRGFTHDDPARVGRRVVVDLFARPVGTLAPVLQFGKSICLAVRELGQPMLLGQHDFLERVAFSQRNQAPGDTLEIRQVREP